MKYTVGLRTEILLNLALLLGAALLFGGLLLLRWTEQAWVVQQAAAVRGGVEVAATALRQIGPGREGERSSSVAAAADRLLGSLPEGFGLQEWLLLDEGLEVVAASGGRSLDSERAAADRANRGAETEVRIDYASSLLPWQPTAGDGVTVAVPLGRAPRSGGVLLARFSLDAVRERTLDTLGLVLVFAVGYGGVLVLSGGYLLHRNVVRPVRQLREVTQRVASGDLGEAIPAEGPREIASLAKDFNAMTAALAASREETRRQIVRLEGANVDLRRARSELLRSEKMASVGHLAAGMAHEIGNPLGAATGYLELLRGKVSGAGERDLVERSQAELGRIERLVRDLLDFAAPGSAEPVPLDPAARLREAGDLLVQQGAFREVRLENELPDFLPAVRVVPHRLTQVFVNLLLNARDASPPGGAVRIAGGEERGWVWLAVTDQGEGIPPERLEKIFDPFFTTKPPGQGRGLGLSVCHRILEEAGGRLEVRSAEGEGANFTVRLRRMDGDA